MKPLPPSKWDDSLQHILDDMSGRPLNIHCVMANHPDLLQAWWQFRNYSVGGGDLVQRDCELVILRVSVHMKTWYEWAAHVDRGLAAGLSIDQIDRVKNGPAAADWDARDSTLLQAVDELIETRSISTPTLDRIGRHFTANQIMDIISIHGVYVTLACMINTWGVEPDADVLERLPESVTSDSFMSGL